MTRKFDEKIGEIVNKYRNIPYKHNGRSLRGLDCLGLIIFFYQEFWIDLSYKDRTYSKEWYQEDPSVYLRELLKVGRAVDFDDLQALDLVYFELLPGVVTHSGVTINDSEFIHILQKRNVEVASFNRFWRKKFAGARRLI